MKFSIAYYLLLLYLTAMFKPLVPVVCDAWGHIFAEARHIATVHAKYGANHLEKQLAACGEDTGGKTQNTPKSPEPVPVHIATQTARHLLVQPGLNNEFSQFLLPKLTDTLYPVVAPPPKLS